MDFALSEEQQLILNGAERFIADRYDFETRRRISASPEGFSREYWSEFAELGWLALPFSEDHGGLGGSAVEVMLLMKAFGAGLVLEPYLSTVLLAGRLIERLVDPGHADEWLGPILAGERLATLAFSEPDAPFDVRDTSTTARPLEGGDWSITGHKAVVLGAPSADLFLVVAREEGRGDRGSPAGLRIFAVEKETPGLEIRGYRTIDGARAGEVIFKEVQLTGKAALGGEGEAVAAALDEVLDGAALAASAEIVGMMEAVLAKTRAHLSTRRQFGRPLAAFQVLQHRLADMLVAIEETRSLVEAATMTFAIDSSSPETRRMVSAARVRAIEAGEFVTAQGVQLHGGMGVSEELDIGTYFKHFHALKPLFGDADFHRRRFLSLVAVA